MEVQVSGIRPLAGAPFFGAHALQALADGCLLRMRAWRCPVFRVLLWQRLGAPTLLYTFSWIAT